MRAIFIFILSMSMLLTSCQRDVEKPDNLIPREEMKSILKDIYLYRSINEVNYAKNPNLSLDEVNKAVLAQHGVSVETFDASYRYYVLADAAYDEMLLEIKDEIKENELLSKQDSLSP